MYYKAIIIFNLNLERKILSYSNSKNKLKLKKKIFTNIKQKNFEKQNKT